MRRPRRPLVGSNPEAGFGLLEVTISSALFLLLLAGVSTMLVSAQNSFHDAQLVMEAQQGARIAMAKVQRDLQSVGVGLSRLQPPFSVVVPRVDGGIDLRVNQGQVTSFLDLAMGSGSSAIHVDDVTGFAVGQVVAVYDATGSIDMTTITHINGPSGTIVHTGVSKGYDPDDGAAVAAVETVTYRTVPTGDTVSLVREVDGADPAVLATGLDGVTFRYFDDSNPPAEITPTSLAEQLSIRTLEVTIVARANGTRLIGGTVPEISLTARITPRSLVLF